MTENERHYIEHLRNDIATLIHAMLHPAPGSKGLGCCHMCGAVQLWRRDNPKYAHHPTCEVLNIMARAQLDPRPR